MSATTETARDPKRPWVVSIAEHGNELAFTEEWQAIVFVTGYNDMHGAGEKLATLHHDDGPSVFEQLEDLGQIKAMLPGDSGQRPVQAVEALLDQREDRHAALGRIETMALRVTRDVLDGVDAGGRASARELALCEALCELGYEGAERPVDVYTLLRDKITGKDGEAS